MLMLFLNYKGAAQSELSSFARCHVKLYFQLASFLNANSQQTEFIWIIVFRRSATAMEINVTNICDLILFLTGGTAIWLICCNKISFDHDPRSKSQQSQRITFVTATDCSARFKRCAPTIIIQKGAAWK